MHFDQREQQALREAGLSTDEIQAASEAVADATHAAAADLEEFFEQRAVVYSDMDRAHSATEVQTHEAAELDVYTHADELRGYLRFEGWGAYVEDGRVLSADVVELTLGPTIHDRVRFAGDRDAL